MPVTLPNLIGLGRTDAEATLDALLLRHVATFPFAISGDGSASAQFPPAGTVVPLYTVVTVTYPSPLGPLDDSPVEGPSPGGRTDPRSNGIPWLMTAGSQIVTADTGVPVLLRGVNNMHSEWAGDMTWEKRAVPEMATDWKGNFWGRGFAADPVNAGDAGYLSLLDTYQSLCEANRVHLMLSFRSHGINGDQPPAPDGRATQALATLAARYNGKSNVIFALQAEPHQVDWASLRPMFEGMIDAIRSAAWPHVPLIMVPGTNWSRDLAPAVASPVLRDDIVYKSHPYNPSSDFPALFGVAHDAGWPVFIGEFGPFEPMTVSDVSDLLDFARTRQIGWAAWSFDYDDPDVLHKLVDGTLSPTSPYGLLVRQEMLSTPPMP